MKPPSKAKLSAYKQHWKSVTAIQDELSRQYIHEALSIGDVAADAYLCHTTVKRFFQRGRIGTKMGYSLFHGPSITTIVGIAGVIGCRLEVTRPSQTTRRIQRILNKPNGARNATSK